MKVILLKDVPKLGRKYDTKYVSDGHAQNFLIPRGLVVIATPQAVEKINKLKEMGDKENKIQAELLSKNLETLHGKVLTIHGKANDKGHLFAGISKEMIMVEIFKQLHLNIAPENIVLPKPLKEIGEHKLVIEALGKKAEMKVVVESE